MVRIARIKTLLAVLCLGLLAPSSPGEARPPRPAALKLTLGLGLCVPELVFSGAEERHTFVTALAQHLSRALGRPVEGFAYINPADLRRDLRAGRLHFAVVGGLFAATLPAEQILAQARPRTTEMGTWSLLARSSAPLKALKGQRLQIPRLGPHTARFVRRGVLGGSLDVEAHFKVQWSPDLLAAAQAVRLRQADVLIAPLAIKGLVPLTRGYSIPPPAFVVLSATVPAELVNRARLALLAYGSGPGALQGWYMADPSAYDELSVLIGHKKPADAVAPGRR